MVTPATAKAALQATTCTTEAPCRFGNCNHNCRYMGTHAILQMYPMQLKACRTDVPNFLHAPHVTQVAHQWSRCANLLRTCDVLHYYYQV